MKISEVSQVVDLPVSTIRYYEKMGMIPEEYILREENNYRNYAPGIIQHLSVVKNCLSVGFSIQDVKSMIAKNRFSKEEQARILQDKILEIEAAQNNLEASKQSLHSLLEHGVGCEQGFAKS